MKNKIKNSITWLALSVAIATCNLEPSTCKAQTTNAPTQQFWDTALGYFSSFNTNLTTFTATNWHGNIWAGADATEHSSVRKKEQAVDEAVSLARRRPVLAIGFLGWLLILAMDWVRKRFGGIPKLKRKLADANAERDKAVREKGDALFARDAAVSERDKLEIKLAVFQAASDRIVSDSASDARLIDLRRARKW